MRHASFTASAPSRNTRKSSIAIGLSRVRAAGKRGDAQTS
jgi:hypothetical protein